MLQVATFETPRGLSRNEPSTTEKKARTEGCCEYRTPRIGGSARRRLQNRVKGNPTRGRAKIAEMACDNGKFVQRQIALLSQKGDKTRIRLVSCQAL